MIFADDRKHVHARRGRRPEDFDYFPFRINVAGLPHIEANHDFVANIRGCSLLLISLMAHVNVMYESGIIGHNIVKVPRPLQCADDGIVSALEDSNDTPFTASFDPVMGRIARYTRNHAVAVHGRPNLFAPGAPKLVLESYVRLQPSERNNMVRFIELTRFQPEV